MGPRCHHVVHVCAIIWFVFVSGVIDAINAMDVASNSTITLKNTSLQILRFILACRLRCVASGIASENVCKLNTTHSANENREGKFCITKLLHVKQAY